MAEDDGQEKSFDPTPQRLERARSEGDIPRSADVNTAAAYLGLLIAIATSGGAIASGMAAPLVAFLAHPDQMVGLLLGPGGPALAASIFGPAALAVAPLFLAPALAVIVSLFAQRAFTVTLSKLEPKLSRLSPIENAKQKFGLNGLVEFAKAVTKLVLIALIVTLMVIYGHEGVVGLIALDARALPEILADETVLLLGATLAIVGVIAAADMLWQIQSHHARLRMSLQELRDESKNSDGDPHVKAQRRERGRQIAMNRMLADVPKADVVIVNPTHYAVALKWSRTPGAAPVCVAKGVDHVAARIRALAEENGVPIHSDPPTARALHAVVELGEEIRPEHYRAVAVAIRFADTVRKRAIGRVTRREP